MRTYFMGDVFNQFDAPASVLVPHAISSPHQPARLPLAPSLDLTLTGPDSARRGGGCAPARSRRDRGRAPP